MFTSRKMKLSKLIVGIISVIISILLIISSSTQYGGFKQCNCKNPATITTTQNAVGAAIAQILPFNDSKTLRLIHF